MTSSYSIFDSRTRLAEATNLPCKDSSSPAEPFVLLSSAAVTALAALAAAEQLLAPAAEPNNSSLRAALTFAVVSQTTETGMELADVGVCGGILLVFAYSLPRGDLYEETVCIPLLRL